MPKTKWFLRIAAAAGVLSVIMMEAGWVVTEVGRQPWIVRNYMRVEDAATGNTGVWITFLVVVVLYLVVAVTHDPRAARHEPAVAEAGGDLDETDVPYGPRGPVEPPRRRPGGGEGAMSWADVVAVVLFFGVIAYALFGGADFGAGFWDLIAGGADRGEHPRRSSTTRSARSGRPTTSG